MPYNQLLDTFMLTAKTISNYLELPFCNQPWNTLYVPWNGTGIRPGCCGRLDLGDLSKAASIEDIWNGSGFTELRDQINKKEGMNRLCLLCYKNLRHYADHISPFLDIYPSLPPSKKKNYLNAIKNCNLKKTSIKNKPYIIYLDISSKCNIRCRKCFVYSSKNLRSLGHMTMETFSKVIPLLPTAIKVICTGVGESLTNPEFMDMLKIIKENNCAVSFNSNGQLLDKNTIRQLMEHEIDEIVLSIDSVNEDMYAYHHRGAKLSALMGNLEALQSAKSECKSEKPVLGWFFVAMRSNIQELPQIASMAPVFGFKSIYVAPLSPFVLDQNEFYANFYDNENLTGRESDKALLKKILDDSIRIANNKNMVLRSGFTNL